MKYVELRAHSAFSFGDGAVSPEGLAVAAAELGFESLGLTDNADLGGIVRFTLETRRQNLRPVIGVELNVDGHPAAFLARTKEGFTNLGALVTRARAGKLAGWKKGQNKSTRGRPGITWDELAERSEGIHALTGPASGKIASLLDSENYDLASRELAKWRDVFGERLAVEVQMHNTGGREAALASALIELASRNFCRWVVTHDPRYVDHESRLVHDVLTALRHDMDIDTALANGVLHPNGEWKLQSPQEMMVRWNGREEGIAESERIALECGFDLSWVRPPMPHFDVPPGYTDITFLREKVYEGARVRWGEPDEKTRAQIEHELGVIGRLGFSGFFLVMWDAVRFAHSRNILAQGRGSAANSAVAYCLAITAVDPVRHGLLFERFLSEIRMDGQTEAPDIDVDIEHDRREEVLDYVYGKYARTHAAITCIVQTYRGPNAFRDSMRAFGYPVEITDRISKRLHHNDPLDGAQHVAEVLAPRFGLDVSDARGKAMLTAMAAFQNIPRLRATHVGGFVLSSAPLGDYMPIEHTSMGRTIIQFDKDDLDAVGVPKFDFLGLGALALVRRAFDFIEKRTGERPQMYKLPPDDPETYAMVSAGETLGTFQVESRAQISSVLHTKPERLYDLVVQVALIRPGPIQARFVHPYTRRRRGQEPVTYAHPLLEPILKRTQGIPIFQEQAMSIAMVLGGYSAAEADELRRTMGHVRKLNRLLNVLEKLRARMVERGVEEKVAAQIAEDLRSFANYGFPESHAWSFALIAYATVYLKRHYPAEFFAGLLNAWPMGFYPRSTLIHDARRNKVPVRPPCLKDGDADCTVEPDEDPDKPAMRVGWRHIRGISEKTLETLKACSAERKFDSIEDVVRRARLKRADALKLARAGAFSAWQPDRRKAAWDALRVVGDDLPLAPARMAEHEPRPLGRDELVFMDYFTTGVSINGHPMQHLREKMRNAGVLHSDDIKNLQGGEPIVVAGLVTVRQQPVSAKGTIFLMLEDEFGFMNVIVSPKLIPEFGEVVRYATFILVKGRFERDGPVMNVIGHRFKEINVKKLVYQPHSFH